MPKGPHEPCTFFDVYSEVQILERFQGDARVCQILDYGVDRNSFVLVLKHYKCSLRVWRQRHTQQHKKTRSAIAPLRERLPLYLDVYAAVLEAVSVLLFNHKLRHCFLGFRENGAWFFNHNWLPLYLEVFAVAVLVVSLSFLFEQKPNN